MDRRITIIGGGLAGSEAAFQLAVRGWAVTLLEMRPEVAGPAHHTGDLAELVCSNSFKSCDPNTAAGMLKRELESMGSLILAAARASSVPAGGALAVDRTRFSALVAGTLASLPGLTIARTEAVTIPEGPVIVATGPLTSPALEPELTRLVGEGRLAFYDAAAPVIDAATIDRDLVFAQSRYDKGAGADYLNCPLDREQYEAFIDALLAARRVTAKEFESADLFQACQPVEEIARKGRDALRFGTMKPVGLTDPVTGARPWAVVQLRAENLASTAYNLVGFQTNLTFTEQQRVFRMIPGLGDADFLRYGVMHRNTFVDAPRLLTSDLALREHPSVRFAGQLTGTEGYMEAAASGLVAALGACAQASGSDAVVVPPETALGALLTYATGPLTSPYQPMHVNFGLVPPLAARVRGKQERYAAYAERGTAALATWVASRGDLELDIAVAAAERVRELTP
ncbi:MAG: methylenetetrahydrofolate--tRNA-(uracil(54)-C(5))-methyltransferase (FADH(2)-oxidizing) TrmFO [Coriobacteriia bacterium]|nr:methylenetetrahydrofolate--tRNA-(uracil(54)-C(5))-methyltransferase (FADH(2)-oxidizing) TrmFO [Coriobacteriia bacterium]